jgi:formylmethanofuran--tetrahydromethanopterin N-formyltransferase
VEIRGVLIEDTFAEAFPMRAARLVITARTPRWAREAALKLTGFATSVIACKCEAAIERELTPDETPDARPGISVLLFTMDTESLGKRLVERLGQTVLTCPTTSCFDGLPDAATRTPSVRALRTFGDGLQASKVIGDRRYWRVPVMEGEFLMQESFGVQKGVGGGNFLILAEDADSALAAAEGGGRGDRGTAGRHPAVPGRDRAQRQQGRLDAVHGDDRVDQRRVLPHRPLAHRVVAAGGVNAVLELVLDGLDAAAISDAMRVGIEAACLPGVRVITAGNYGGKLGPHHFHLRQIMGGESGAAT